MAYIEHLLILICIYIILSVSLNLIVGFTGILNIGHAAFFGIGAYTSALLMLSGFPFIMGFLGGAIVAAFFGLLIGIPSLRLRGDYLAIATLGFGEIIRSLMKNWTSLTRGPLGLPGIPKASFIIPFNTPLTFLILAAIVALITIAIVSKMVNSPFGRVLRSIREDEIAAQALGKNTSNYKLTALIIGAGFAGIAGSLYAHYITFIDPSTFTLTETILMLCMVVLGGMASIQGSIIGAIIIILIPEPLRFIHMPSHIIAATRQMIYAALLIVLMLYRPQGIIGEKTT
jgi:branched-chain amino acid transport system permease protein